MLGAHIESLVLQLLPGGRRDGRHWRCGSLAGEAGQSLAVELFGARRGRWVEFNGDIRGDALDLVAQCCCRGDIGEALQWARGWLGLSRLNEVDLARQRERLIKAEAHAKEQAARQAKKRQAAAKRIWLAGAALRRGDLVWRYLLGRGIDLGRLPRLPGALRAHPGLYHAKSGRYWPAMVAAITGLDADGEAVHTATQRTWVEPQHNGHVTKAPLGAAAKMSLGPFRHLGGAIHLARGGDGRPWHKAAPGGWVAIAEGVEDGLSFAILRPDFRVAALATSLAYLAAVALPPGCRGVVVIRQNDRLGSDADRAAKRGIAALQARGLDVRQVLPPPGVKDINDCLQLAAAS